MHGTKLPQYREFRNHLFSSLGNMPDVIVNYYAVINYIPIQGPATKTYALLKLASRNIAPDDPIVLIRAGIHGNETAGPLTIFRYAPEIFRYAHQRGVKLIIYPLDNPSGFEADLRYNIEHDPDSVGRRFEGNNDFIEYELDDRMIVGNLWDNKEFIRWFWSSDSRLGFVLPKETLALHQELRRIAYNQVRAVIDLHQDASMILPVAYHYGFGDLEVYNKLIRQIALLIPVLRNEHTESGPLIRHDYVPDQFDPKTDQNGFIVQHDGSLTDLFYRLGTRHSITVETSCVTPDWLADRVNLTWIYGLIYLVSNESD